MARKATAKTKPTTKPEAKKDEFGLRKTTNTSTAASMFKKGCTMQDVKKKTGSNQYNVLKFLERQGHKVSKDKETGVITVTPKPEAA